MSEIQMEDTKKNETLYEYRKVLDKGFVRLVDHMGSDARIVQSARVSYGEGTKTFREDRGLIRYLLRNSHTSPFEQVVFTFHVKMPVFVARQWTRHRTARLNEISGRYSVMNDDFYVPEGEDINAQSNDNKQGRNDIALSKDLQEKVRGIIKEQQECSYKSYMKLLDDNIARELARVTLPLAMYTEMYWQIDLHNLFHFLRLRMDKHAQKEIRDYAQVMFTIVKEICPFACEAFEEYVLGKVDFYKSEAVVLAMLLKIVSDNDMLRVLEESSTLNKREREQFLAKIQCLKTSKYEL